MTKTKTNRKKQQKTKHKISPCKAKQEHAGKNNTHTKKIENRLDEGKPIFHGLYHGTSYTNRD